MKFIRSIKSLIEWGITQYLRIRPKKTYWAIAVAYFFFILGEYAKNINEIAKIISEAASNAENVIVKFLLEVVAFWLALDLPWWCILIITLVFLFVSIIKILEVRGNRQIIYHIEHQQRRKLTKEEVKGSLKSQTERQINKQKSSGKYIPDTFIETRDLKDRLRYLCDSVFFSEKLFEETEILDFRFLNTFLSKGGHPAFEFSLDHIVHDPDGINLHNCEDIVDQLFDYLLGKHKELTESGISSNELYKFERKIKDKLEDAKFYKSRVAIITEYAGQGKTNLVCDFVDNFLIKREIPVTFLTGYEIDGKNIRESILKRIFPDFEDVTFENFIKHVKQICEETNSFYVLIIDGLNENTKPKEFSSNIENFLAEILEYEFLKVVLTSRTEYFENNFSNLKKASFKDRTEFIGSLNDRLSKDLKERLYDAYLRHFSVKIKGIRKDVYNQLVDNFLLLRIFTETYQNQELTDVDDIYKEELFDAYYKLKCEEVNSKLTSNDEFNLKGHFDIKDFLKKVTEHMIANKKFANVPLDDIIEDDIDRELYIRFLDENILVKRDLDTSNTMFAASEVVNFTFDEFRDYTISKYMVEYLLPSSKEEFESFVKDNLTDEAPILEGCSSFLFYLSKKGKNSELTQFLQEQEWYDKTFIRGIFSIKDNEIIEDDIGYLKKLFNSDKDYARQISIKLVYRRFNIKTYKSLNIQLLFEIIQQLSSEEFEELVKPVFRSGIPKHSIFRGIDLSNLLDQLDEILEENEFSDDESYHNLFELLVYLLSVSWRVRELYERYQFKYKEKAIEQVKTALTSNSEEITNPLKSFIEQYEINV